MITVRTRSCEGRTFLVCTRLQCGVTEGADPALTICNRFCSKCLVDKHGMDLATVDAATFVCPDCDSAVRNERSSSAMQLLAELQASDSSSSSSSDDSSSSSSDDEAPPLSSSNRQQAATRPKSASTSRPIRSRHHFGS